QLTAVATSDDSHDCSSSSLHSRVVIDVAAGQTYWVEVDQAASDLAPSGSVSLHWQFRPANDDFANAETLSLPSDAEAATTDGATKQSGEPTIASNGGGHSIWYKVVSPHNGSMSVTTCDSQFDTLLGVYTGT